MSPASPYLQAAAICYRRREGALEFLLVRTLDDRWIIPKGNIEPDQTPTDAAEMEAYEEAGVFGKIDRALLTIYRYMKSSRGREIECAVYLLEVREAYPPQETYRHPQWFSVEEAIAALAEGREPEDARELERVVRAGAAQLSLP